MDDAQRKLLERKEEERRDALRERMKGRSEGIPMPNKCNDCGYFPCICECPGCKVCGGTGRVKKRIDSSETIACPHLRSNKMKSLMKNGDAIGGLTPNEVQILTWLHIPFGISDAYKSLPIVKDAVRRGHGFGIMMGLWPQNKTTIMKIAVATFLRTGRKAQYVRLLRLINSISTLHADNASRQLALLEAVEEWKSDDLLCIDSIPADTEHEWAAEIVSNLMEDRWNAGVEMRCLTIAAFHLMKIKDLPEYITKHVEGKKVVMLDKKGKDVSFVVYLNGPK